MKEKQREASLPFPILIIEFYQRDGVPKYPTSNIEVTLSSTIDIKRIVVENM